MEYTPDQEPTDSSLAWMAAALVVAMFFAGIVVWCSCGPAEASVTKAPTHETVLATGFAHKGDVWAGEKFFCLRRPVDDKTPGIAHRWRRCGSRVRITNRRTGRSVVTRVTDRGPYWLVPISCAYDAVDARGFRHASHACWRRGRPANEREQIRALKRLPPPHGLVYANDADLTPPTRRAIGHNGKEPVDLEWR